MLQRTERKTLMKINKYVLALSMILLTEPAMIHASKVTLFSISNYTWATSIHGDEYTADKYYGEVSIRGADRVIHGNDICYPTRVNIYYNVQDTLYQAHVNSTGKNDTTQRKNSITVNDLWNLGAKTEVWGNYDYAPTGFVVNSSGEIE